MGIASFQNRTQAQAASQKSGFQDLYSARDKVAAKNDPKEWLKWYQANTTSGYTVQGKGDKPISRDELIKKIEWASKVPMKSNNMTVVMKTKVDSCTVTGAHAEIEVTEQTSMTSKVVNPSTLATRERIHDAWAKVGGVWKMTGRKVLDHKQVVIKPKAPNRSSKTK